MKSLQLGRLTRRGRWSATILGAIMIAGLGTGLLGGRPEPRPGRIRRGARWPSGKARQQRVAAGKPDGLITVRQGNMEMAMTRLSGRPPTWAELQRVYTMVHSAATAMAKYHTLAAAQKDGYMTAPDLLVDGQGAHYFDPNFETRAGFDPAHPAFLVYNPVHGHQVLSGLMYYVPGSLTPRPTGNDLSGVDGQLAQAYQRVHHGRDLPAQRESDSPLLRPGLVCRACGHLHRGHGLDGPYMDRAGQWCRVIRHGHAHAIHRVLDGCHARYVAGAAARRWLCACLGRRGHIRAAEPADRAGAACRWT